VITLEQASSSQVDTVFASITQSVRDLAGSNTPGARISGLHALVKLLRFISAWSMETRAPKVNTEVATAVNNLVNAMTALLSGTVRTNVMGSAKVVAESLKSIIVSLKSTVPARLGPEITEDEQKQLLDDALSKVQHAQNRFLQNAPPVFSHPSKQNVKHNLEKIIVEMHSITSVLCDTQTKATPDGPVLLSAMLNLTSSVVALGGSVVMEIEGGKNEYMLLPTDLAMYYANIVAVIAACRATRNRIAHQSHLSIAILGLATAISIIVDASFYNMNGPILNQN